MSDRGRRQGTHGRGGTGRPLGRRAPAPLSGAVERVAAGLAPATLLAEVQRVWPAVAGEAIAGQAEPVAERDGVVSVTCASSVWAAELDLLAPGLVQGLNRALGADRVRALRCSAAPRR